MSYPTCLLDASKYLTPEAVSALRAYRAVTVEKEAWDMWGELQRMAQVARPDIGQAILLVVNAISREVNLRLGYSRRRGKLGDGARITVVLDTAEHLATLANQASEHNENRVGETPIRTVRRVA